MEGILTVSVFLLLMVAKGNASMDSLKEPEDSTLRNFIVEHHKDTREVLKLEIHSFFATLSESINANMEAIRSDMERSHENLSQSFRQELTTVEGKLESKFRDFSNALARQISKVDEKMEGSLQNISESFALKFGMIETKILSQLEDLSKTVGVNHHEMSQSIANSSLFATKNAMTTAMEIPFERNHQNKPTSTTGQCVELQEPVTRVEIEEISGDSGTIEFNGGENSQLQRKIWVFRTKEATYFTSSGTKFVMEENNLGGNAFLTLWDNSGNVVKHVWNGLQSDWSSEVSASEHLILLTLTMTPSATPVPFPSFKLRFTVTNGSSSWFHSGEVVSKNGVSLVSYPPQNTQNYPPKGAFHLVVAPSSGITFKLTLKYLDVPGTPLGCSDNSLKVYFLEENSTGGNYKPLNTSAYRVCGRVGNVSELIGTANGAIVQFHSQTSNVGRGIRLEVDTN